MKGTATITLTDAKTGETVSRTVEHNLVTNALKNIFNPCHYGAAHNFSYSDFLAGGLPMWKNLLSGVMLLGNNIEENPDSILLPAGSIPIGTAGSEYAGANIYRGSLNLNESYQTENGYRFTWDFGTDKANGTIRCVALTSKLFGDTGFHSDDNSVGSFLLNPATMDIAKSDYNATFERAHGQYVGTFESGVHTFVSLNSDKKLVFRKYRGADLSALKINDSVGLAEVSEPFFETEVTPTVNIDFDDRFFIDPETKIIYYFGDKAAVTDSSMSISFMGISVDSFKTVTTKTVTIPINCENKKLGAVWKNHIFFLAPDGLFEYDMSGNQVGSYTAPYSDTTIFFVLNDCLMSQSSSGAVWCYSFGESTKTSLSKYVFPTPNVDFKPPYAAVCRRKSHRYYDSAITNTPAMAIVSPYLATVNNLSQPIEKTSAHTLKICYDITN